MEAEHGPRGARRRRAIEDAKPEPRPKRSALAAHLAVVLLALAFVPLLALLPVRDGTLILPPTPSPLRFAIALAHVPLMAAFLFLRQSGIGMVRGEECLPRSPLARRAFVQVLDGTTWLVASWMALYAWLAYLWSGSTVLGAWTHGPKGLVLADAFNTAGSAAFFYLYLVLDKPSVSDADQPARDGEFRRSWIGVLAVCVSTVAVTLLGRHGWLGLQEIGPLAGSFLAAIAMMYFFGQLDYRYMRVRRLWIAPLYLYVAIQMAWHEIARAGDGSGYAEVLLIAALVLKAYLLGMLLLWIRDRTLQKYLDFASL
jgi:hypothetical protein